MTQNKEVSIEDMNEAICKFMGGYRRMGDMDIYKGPDEIEWETGTYLKYHSDWNWLMPVVEKIGSTTVKSSATYNPDLMFKVEITNGYTQIKGTGERIFYNSSVEGSMLNATYKAVFHFITWYNTTLK